MSLLERLFKLKENHSSLKTEVIAGLTTFSTCAYAILLLPSILSDTGMDFGAVMTATLLAGAFASLLMGFLANYPFILAPGIALSVYFTYSVVLAKGHEWQVALGIVFLTGALFMILNLLRVRQLIIEAIPVPIRIGTTAGLGLFLALIGLKDAGIVVSNPATLLAFGDATAMPTIMTGVSLLVMMVLMARRVPGAIFLGIVLMWVVALVFGLTKFEGIVSWPASMAPTFFQLDVRNVFHMELFGVAVGFIFVSLFDTSGTLIGLAEEGGFIEECEGKRCHFPRISKALIPDATGSMVGAFLGTTTQAVYIESAAGIAMGGRTGLTSVVVGLLFLTALFFSPFAMSIPQFATTPALLIIGGLMLKTVVRLDWKDASEWIPGFATLILIPLTFSVALGIGVGFIAYPLAKLFSGKWRDVHWLAWILCPLFLLKFAFLPNI